MRKKLLLLALAVVFLIAGVFVYLEQKNAVTVIENENVLFSKAEEYLKLWNETDFQMYQEQYADNLNDDAKEQFQTWDALKKKVGQYNSIVDKECTETDGIPKVTLLAQYSKETIQMVVMFDENDDISDVTIDVYIPVTLKEKVEKAALNTVMGISIVFIVLIVISFIISLFKYIPKAIKFFSEDTKAEAVVQEVPVIEETEEDVTDDLELVAVVTAAIMASLGEEAPANGLVVRSIKRRKKNQWKKA